MTLLAASATPLLQHLCREYARRARVRGRDWTWSEVGATNAEGEGYGARVGGGGGSAFRVGGGGCGDNQKLSVWKQSKDLNF